MDPALRLPHISLPALRLATEPLSLRAEGTSSVSAPLITATWRGARAETAAPQLNYRGSWPPGYLPSNVAANRAQTAMGRFSVECLPKQICTTDKAITMIKEKINSSFHGVRKMFQASDPKGEGTVSNLGIVGLSRISFVDFVGCFQETKVMKNKWMILTTLKQLQDNDTMLQNSKTSFLQQKSSGKLEESIKNDFTLLKQKMHERGFAMQAHFPPSCLEVGGAITAKQLKEALESMGIIMNKNDFNNLWVRIDAERKWKVPTQQFLTQMGINSQGTVHCTTMLSPNDPLTGVNEDLTRTQAAKSKQKTSNSVINFDDDVIKIFKVKEI
ncbi:uncharacterized protein LOC103179922 [Callorhinchus milii]|uniref:uncharacterized protein LOC103179922 n=1 Tax=Callorhinchus milii TaxID=7868 RepID=UPI00045762B6|nr:uncharacterized protein LOC103179922 [Callorhinchus milii]|eukprot:gi/632955810/ref/XP_007893648.1/ PREDICTED: uncharacterized protein LOC103179922 [Callorhinchus milii]